MTIREATLGIMRGGHEVVSPPIIPPYASAPHSQHTAGANARGKTKDTPSFRLAMTVWKSQFRRPLWTGGGRRKGLQAHIVVYEREPERARVATHVRQKTSLLADGTRMKPGQDMSFSISSSAFLASGTLGSRSFLGGRGGACPYCGTWQND